MKKVEVSEFWQGWESALDELETKLRVLYDELRSNSNAKDALLDMQNHLKELRKLKQSLT